MTPTCATCTHWVRSHLPEHDGHGICTEASSGPKPRKADYKRPLYVPRDGWCEQHARPSPRPFIVPEQLT